MAEWPAALFLVMLILSQMRSGPKKHATHQAGPEDLSMWQRYKRLLNRMSKEEFQQYKVVDVFDLKKGENVLTKGYYKIDYVMQGAKRLPKSVLELGGGAGGMTQWFTQRREVETVDTLNYDREGHGEHKLRTVRTAGYAKNTVVYGDVHDFEKEKEYDLVVSDIGESKSNEVEQLRYSRKKRLNFERILSDHNGLIVYKEL